MKKRATLIFVAALSILLPSCMTTYDAHGNPVQSVDPGAAAVGIVAAGFIGAAIANDNDHHDHYKGHHGHHRRHHGGHHRRHH